MKLPVVKDDAPHGGSPDAILADRIRELEELANHLQISREEENRKLARLLHDGLGSILISAKMDIESVAGRMQNSHPELVGRLQRAQASLEQAVLLKRQVIEELRPSLLDNLGLAAAVEWQVTEVCRAAKLECVVNVNGEAIIPGQMSITLFRLVQEALANAVQHARATRISVEITGASGNVLLIVEDDGIGIATSAVTSPLSHGISAMRHRVRALGGEFVTRAGTQGGTTVEVSLPNPEPAAIQARD